MRNITVLSGGKSGARFVSGLLDALASSALTGVDDDARVTVIANTADDLWVHGLKVCPDLDALMHALRPGGGEGGTRDQGHQVQDELVAYGVEPTWFGLGDRDVATHLVRTQMIEAGYPLSAVTAALTQRWNDDVTLLPMSDDRVETHVAVAEPESPSGRRVVHLQEYRRRLGAGVPAQAVVTVGLDRSAPAPGVVEAISEADLVLLAPSDPVASLGTVLGVPGVREAVRATRAPVIGLSPVAGGRALHAPEGSDSSLLRLLAASAVDPSALGVGRHLGARSGSGVLDAWVVDASDAAALPHLEAAGLKAAAAPLLSSAPADVVAVLRTLVEVTR